MLLHPTLLALMSASLMINAEATVHAQLADQFQQLVEASAERLAIAKQVALAKWDSGAPVDDEVREAQVIGDAVRMGEARGLSSYEISQFFKAQIEANKLVQYSLLADWRRIGKAPEHQPVNLNSLRPKLDLLEVNLIEELARAAAIRAARSCGSHIARAVGKYVSAHRIQTDSLDAVALDRSLAATCTAGVD